VSPKSTKKATAKRTTKKAGNRGAKKTPTKRAARKKTAKKKPVSKTAQAPNKPETPPEAPPPIEIPQSLLEEIIRRLAIEGDSEDDCRKIRGYEDEVLEAAIAEAHRRFRKNTGIDRLAEIGAGIERLRHIIGVAIAGSELTQAIQAQRELGKLLALYPKAGEGEGNRPPEIGSEAASELEEIAGYLRPLELAPDSYPLSGLARIAAEKLMEIED